MKIKAYLYQATDSDEEIDLEDFDLGTLDDKKLLWINVLETSEESIRQVASRLELEHVPVRSIVEGTDRPKVDNFEKFFRFSIESVHKPDDGDSHERQRIEFLVGENFVVTIHEGEVAYFEEFRNREKGETRLGRLDAETFVATLLDMHIVSYFRALEDIEHRVDRLDAKVLKVDMETKDFLEEMVKLRKDVSKLRRWLLPHRDVIYALSRADFLQIAEIPETREQYDQLNRHFDNAVDAIENSRETVLSIFDLYATKSAQMMNTFIQRLTFLTLITGSLSVVAGVLGMNYKVDFFESPMGFWVTVAGMLLVGIGMTIYARLRKWI